MKKYIFLLTVFLWTGLLSYAQNADIKILTDSAKAGSINAQIDLALTYLYGDSAEVNHQEAFRWISKAADTGDSFAKCVLGECYENGYGVAPNLQKAVDLYMEAAANHVNRASLWLSVMYEYGNKVLHRDLSKAFLMVKQALDNGSESAPLLIAKYYFNGWGVEKSKEEAIKCLRQAAENGLAEEANAYIKNIERNDTLSLYELEFRILPRLMNSVQADETQEARLTDMEGLSITYGSYFISHYEFDWADIKTERVDLSDGAFLILYTMPDPPETPLCKYMATVVDRAHHRFAYYTLEKSAMIPWFFCGVASDMTHLNFGPFKDKPTQKNFIKAVLGNFSKRTAPQAQTVYEVSDKEEKDR